MKIVQGKYNEAKIYTDVVDDGAIAQIQAMCDTPVFEQSKIRVIPNAVSLFGLKRTCQKSKMEITVY